MPAAPLSLIATALLPLLAQVGPFTAPGTRGTPFPERIERPAKASAPPAAAAAHAPVPTGSARLRDCLAAVDADAEAGEDQAAGWLKASKGHDSAEAGLCLGVARSQGQDWSGAEQAFVAAREASGADRLLRARLGAMAGNAALAGGAAARALAALDTARSDAAGLGDAALLGPLALDRARALVALDRLPEAGAALTEARTAMPGDADAWLLSATLSRRQGQLAAAQDQIQRAAELRPIDPAIGLEAGVIAMLAGQAEAARKSWQSVLAMDPDGAAAATAHSYLAQLPAPAAGGKAPAGQAPTGR